jgi:hypothetical protein
MPREASVADETVTGAGRPRSRRPSDNERKACDAVVRALEKLAGCGRTNAHSPEDLGAQSQVEYMFELEGLRYAIEHTIVEAFAEQMRTNVDFQAFVDPIVTALDRRLPQPGKFDLVFEIDPSKGLKPRHILEAQRAVIAWVETNAAELHAECPAQPSKDHKPFGVRGIRTGSPAGIKLTLTREVAWSLPEKAHGRLFAIRTAPKDYEDLRRERMNTALRKKLPKLHACKEAGARTILVLENGDMALSNHWVICQSAEAALAGRSDRPDEVWLVDTTIPTCWNAWCLIRDGAGFSATGPAFPTESPPTASGTSIRLNSSRSLKTSSHCPRSPSSTNGRNQGEMAPTKSDITCFNATPALCDEGNSCA